MFVRVVTLDVSMATAEKTSVLIRNVPFVMHSTTLGRDVLGLPK